MPVFKVFFCLGSTAKIYTMLYSALDSYSARLQGQRLLKNYFDERSLVTYVERLEK